MYVIQLFVRYQTLLLEFRDKEQNLDDFNDNRPEMLKQKNI